MTHPTDALRLVPSKPNIEMLKAMVRYWQSLPGQIPFANLDRGTEDALIGKAIYTWEAALAAAPASLPLTTESTPIPPSTGVADNGASPLPEGGGWQDLKGAPRDGSEFQAWWKGTWQPRARFDPEYGSFQLWGRTDFDTEGWEAFEIDGFWQPQPAAPTGAK